MQATKQKINKQNKIIAMPNLYDETMHILIEAKHYFTENAHEDQQRLNSMQRLIYSSEMSKITLRLSSVMAWLLARRALHAGQLTPAEVRKQYALQFADICNEEPRFFAHILPEYMLHLHERSLRLYRRIMALDHVELQAHSA